MMIAVLFLLIIGVFMYRTSGMVRERFGENKFNSDSLNYAIRDGENIPEEENRTFSTFK